MAYKVLLIEDDEDQILIIQDTIDSAPGDYAVDTITDPLKLDYHALGDYDIVLCDYNLPHKNGVEVLQDILDIRDIPVIMLTGVEEPEIIIEAFNNGAQDYLVKSDSLLEILPFIIEKNIFHFKAKMENVRFQEDKLRFEVRNKTMRQVITTLAHYINNSTTAISGFAQLCQFEDTSEKNDKLFDVIRRETTRITSVLSELQNLAEQDVIKTVNYVDLENGMFDIESELKKKLNDLYSD